MPRYYFHVRRGQATILDNHGVEFVDPAEVADEAARRALQIEKRKPCKDLPRRSDAIVVDDDVSTVLVVQLRD
jgi:hypothetical protein